jgi:hypothetical protein
MVRLSMIARPSRVPRPRPPHPDSHNRARTRTGFRPTRRVVETPTTVWGRVQATHAQKRDRASAFISPVPKVHRATRQVGQPKPGNDEYVRPTPSPKNEPIGLRQILSPNPRSVKCNYLAVNCACKALF